MNSKKSFFMRVLCILVMLICVIGISACSNPQDNGTQDNGTHDNGKQDSCQHSWGEWSVKTDATCTEAGVKEQTCSLCGETKEETIEALGHTGGTATCAAKAKCERCNTEYGDKAAHKWIDANCTAPKTCEGCSATEGEALGHSGGTATCAAKAKCERCSTEYGDKAAHKWTDANCTTPKTCEGCSATEGEALGHSGGAATCTSLAECTVCGEEYGDKAAHKWTDANCTTPKTCTVCYATEGKALGHSGGAATCTSLAECTVCGEEYGDKAAHKWSDATCSELSTCSSCGETRGDVAAHKWKAATCTTPMTCSVCSETEGEALGHDYKDTVVSPNCTEKGYTTHTCESCGDTYNDSETDANGHSWSEQTCKHERTCSKCDATEPALKHNYEFSGSEGATCTSPQIDTYTCTGCGDFYTDEVGSELGHSIEGVKPTERPVDGTTCDYVQIYKCTVCTEDVEGDRVSHHDYIAKVTTEATCVTDGVKTLTCDDCGHKTTQTIEKNTNAHIWDDGTLSGNIRTYSCTNEGCLATKTAVDASEEESAKVTASDLAQAGGVDLKGASMALDSTTLGAVANKDLTLSAGTLEGDELASAKNKLTPEQLEQLGSNPIYNFTMNDGTQNITSFNGGYITITLPYNVPDGEDVDSVAIWYISEGAPKCIEAAYSNGYVTFQTNHFSYYSVTRLKPEERCVVYGHNIRETVVEATCIKDGYTLEVCIRCAKSEKKDIVKATGHNYTSVEIPATCTAAGNVTYTCGCGYSYKTTIAATGHNWAVAETVEPTCTAAGYIKNVCGKCDGEYKQTKAQIKHTYVDTVVPATCDTNGYTSHKCSMCGNEYKDRMVSAYGHKYTSEWVWSEGNKGAKLVFVCGHDSSHTVEVDANVTSTKKNATCTETGLITYNAQAVYSGAVYKDARTQIIPKTDHTYAAGWESNEASHWHICTVCQAKGDNKSHSLGEAEIIKAATCTQTGESRATCSVCKYVKTQVIPTTAHDYKNGVCTGCGHFSGDCDHSMSNATVTVDLSEYGACEGTIILNTCACGEVKYLMDVESFGGCDLDYDGDPEQGVTDEGNMYMSNTGVCSECGMVVSVYAEAVVGNCMITATYEISATFGDTVVIDKAISIMKQENHNDEKKDFVIEGCSCGDIPVSAYVCVDCGKVTSLRDINLPCDDLTEEEIDYIDDDGFIHEGEAMVCKKCGFKFVEEEYYRYNGCLVEYYEALYIENASGERVLEIIESETDYDHDYEYEYKFNGESCTDGVTVIRTCSVCGHSYSSKTNNHYNTSLKETYDLSNYGACGGYVRVYTCPCGQYGHIDYDYDCKNIIEFMGIEMCSDCGLLFVRTSESVKEGCYQYNYVTTKVAIGETVILDTVIAESISERHNYKYDYDMYGSTCADGYRVSAVCLDCGHSYEDERKAGDSHHSTVCVKRIYFAEHGACGGYIEIYACPCGAEGYTNYHTECHNTSSSDGRYYVDENGISHEVYGWVCNDCGMTWENDSYVIKDGCNRIEHHIFTVAVNGGKLLDSYDAIYGTNDAHDYEYSFNLNGSSCEDGYTVSAVCNACGHSYERERSWHETYTTDRYDFPDFGACYGYIEVRSCACGNESYSNFDYNCSFEWGEDEYYTDSNGIRHTVQTGVCSQCGLEMTIDRYTKKVGCYSVDYRVYTMKMNGETVVSELATVYSKWENHNYEYSFNLNGSSCEEGGVAIYTCSDCGYTDNRDIYDHKTFKIKEYSFAEHGACGGYLRYYECACGQEKNLDWSMGNCYYESSYEYYTDGNGVYHEIQTRACSQCGLKMVVDSYDEQQGCKVYRHVVIDAEINGKTIVSGFKGVDNVRDKHTYEYSFDIHGTSCEDGYTVYGVCKLCGHNYEEERSYHDTEYLRVDYDLSEFGACGGHISANECPCGQQKYFDWSFDCKYTGRYESYTDGNGIYHELRIYTCSDCGIEMIRDTYTVKEGCRLNQYRTYSVTVDGVTVVEEFKYLYSWNDDHDYEYSFMLHGASCEDGYSVTETCRDCGYSRERENSGHNTYKKEYFELSQYGVCGGYIEMGACPCGKYKYFDYSLDCSTAGNSEYVTDGNGIEHYVSTYTCDACGLEMIRDSYSLKEGCDINHYRIYTVKVGDTVLVEDYEYIYSTEQDHNYKYDYNMNGASCEDGYTVTYTCLDCGYSYNEEMNWHNTFRVEYHDLADIGACGGYIEKVSCPCGYEQSVYYGTDCYCQYTSNEYFDEEGRFVHVSVESCDKCGLRIQHSYYELRDPKTCTATRYSTYVVSANGGALEPIESHNSWTAHDYEAVGKLADGAKTCDGGVIITYTCRDCGYSYEERYTWHASLLVETIDLSKYGSVCGGYAYHYSCVCGNSQTVNISEDVLCDFDNNWCEMWIDGYINETQYTVSGSNYFSHSSYIYTCAVTDPEQCAFKIRTAEYWLAVPGECRAERHVVWQFGYDEETGDCEYELTYVSSSRTYHNYTVTNIDETTVKGTEYYCSKCGSSYSSKRYYDSEGYHIKSEIIATNTLDDGNYKYRNEIYEYSRYNGSGYESREYYKHIRADGSEYWYEELCTHSAYTASFGSNGYKVVESYRNSDGEHTEHQYAYTYYKNYSFTVYEYGTDSYNGTWYKYDYSYSFSGGCTRTTRYRNSSGEDSTKTEEYHRSTYNHTTKNPTCTQDGAYYEYCDFCNEILRYGTYGAHGHYWYSNGDGDGYYCGECGLENANGADGDIIFEDFSTNYGNGENYVVGYRAYIDVEFMYYVSIILHTPTADGNDEIILDNVTVTDHDTLRAKVFSKSEVEQLATALGYSADEYDVRFAFVPVGADGSLDYAITFTE